MKKFISVFVSVLLLSALFTIFVNAQENSVTIHLDGATQKTELVVKSQTQDKTFTYRWSFTEKNNYSVTVPLEPGLYSIAEVIGEKGTSGTVNTAGFLVEESSDSQNISIAVKEAPKETFKDKYPVVSQFVNIRNGIAVLLLAILGIVSVILKRKTLREQMSDEE